MKKRINYWDKKSILKLSTIFIVMVVFIWRILFGATNDYTKQISKLDAQTTGILTAVERIKAIQQNYGGSEEKTLGYKITFKYTIKSTQYENTILLHPEQKQFRQFIQQYITEGNDKVTIRYMSKNPEKSLIDFN